MDENEITRWEEDDSPESLAGVDAPDDWSEFEIAWVIDTEGEIANG